MMASLELPDLDKELEPEQEKEPQQPQSQPQPQLRRSKRKMKGTIKRAAFGKMISEDYLEGLIDTFDKESREEARSGSVSPGGTTSSSTLCQRRRPKSETCFPCLFCDFGTDDEKNFRKHAKKKHCEKYWECEMCSYGSQEEDDTACHREQIHSQPNGKLYSCHLCSVPQINRNTLDFHLVLEHNLTPDEPCGTCDYVAYDTIMLKKHCETVHGQSAWECSHCASNYQEPFLSQHRLMLHLKVVHGLNSENEAGGSAHSRKSKSSVATLSANRKPPTCESCHLDFQTKQEFLEHMSTYHEFVIEITPPVRPKRQKMTNSTDPSGLERSQHLEEEEEELAAIEPSLIFECELCLFITSAENDLWEHRQNTHGKNTKGFKCHLCRHTYARKTSIDNHLSTMHHLSKNTSCPSCDYVTYDEYLLNEHSETYHETFNCKYCSNLGEIISSKSELTRHMMEAHRLIKCNSCHVYCESEDALQEHERIDHYKESSGHGDTLPTCKYCPRTFSTEAHMKKHAAMKHKSEVEADKALSLDSFKRKSRGRPKGAPTLRVSNGFKSIDEWKEAQVTGTIVQALEANTLVHHQPLVTYQQVDPQDGGDVVQQQQQHQLIETHSVQVDPSHTDVENIIASVQHQQQQDQTADEGNIVRQPSIIYVQHSDQGTSYQVQYLQDDPSPVVSAAADATQLGEVATTAAAVFGDHSDYHVGPQGAIVTTQQTQQQF